MGDPTDTDDSNPLKLEDVAHAAADLAAEPELDRLLARFLDRVREWAAPSAVLAAVRDPSAESGWRLLPALSFGSGPLGAERALPQLIDETPGCLERPVLVHPGEPAPGVQPRDNCILPWAHEGESGVLVIRGVPRPAPPNLGEALAVLAAPVWPRLLGSPASRVESLVVDLRRVAERLEADAERQIERLRASRRAGDGGHRDRRAGTGRAARVAPAGRPADGHRAGRGPGATAGPGDGAEGGRDRARPGSRRGGAAGVRSAGGTARDRPSGTKRVRECRYSSRRGARRRRTATRLAARARRSRGGFERRRRGCR